MQALVLVGGAGTRLRPLTYEIPKPMLPVVERPMIAHIIEWLARHDVSRVVFSLGYRPDAFVKAFPEGSWAGVELAYAVEPEPLDTAGAIRFVADEAGCSGEKLVVCNGDILTDLDLTALIAFHEAHGGEATLHLTPVADPSPFGVAALDDGGRVTGFVEKPAPGEAPSNLINAGTYVLEPSVLARIDTGRRVSIEREIFPTLVEAGTLFARSSDEYWLDTGTPASYIGAQLDVLRGERPDVELPPCEEINPNVFVGERTRIEGSIEGCGFIGNGTWVQRTAVVENSLVSRGAVVEDGAVLRSAVVLSGAIVRRNAAVEGSIVGPRAVVGVDAVLRSQTIVGAGVVVEDGALLDSVRLPV